MTDGNNRPKDQVVVLVARPGAALLDDDVLALVAGPLAMFMPELRWLDEAGRSAAEMAFTPPPASHYNPRSLESRLRGRLMGLPIDIAVLPLGGRRKKLIITDLPQETPGADVLTATMHAHGGAVRLGLQSAPGNLPAADDILAAVSTAQTRALLDAASLTVAFHADDDLAQAADVRIQHNDLAALLYLQGYHRDEFTVNRDGSGR